MWGSQQPLSQWLAEFTLLLQELPMESGCCWCSLILPGSRASVTLTLLAASGQWLNIPSLPRCLLGGWYLRSSSCFWVREVRRCRCLLPYFPSRPSRAPGKPALWRLSSDPELLGSCCGQVLRAFAVRRWTPSFGLSGCNTSSCFVYMEGSKMALFPSLATQKVGWLCGLGFKGGVVQL